MRMLKNFKRLGYCVRIRATFVTSRLRYDKNYAVSTAVRDGDIPAHTLPSTHSTAPTTRRLNVMTQIQKFILL